MANTLTFKTVYDPGSGSALTEIGATDKLYWQKAGAFAYGATGAIPVNEYNGGFHIINSANEELCGTAHAVNLARGTADGKVSINGAGEVDVSTVTTAQCLNILASCDPNAEVTAFSIFAYGATEADAPAGLTVLGFKQGAAAFADIGGSAAALDLGASASAATHDRYLGLSVKPTSNGAKTATLKASVTVV